MKSNCFEDPRKNKPQGASQKLPKRQDYGKKTQKPQNLALNLATHTKDGSRVKSRERLT